MTMVMMSSSLCGLLRSILGSSKEAKQSRIVGHSPSAIDTLEARDLHLDSGPTHVGRPAGQGTEAPGDTGTSGAADGLDRGHQFRDRRLGQVDRGVPGHGLEVGAESGPSGYRGWSNYPGPECRDPHAEA